MSLTCKVGTPTHRVESELTYQVESTVIYEAKRAWRRLALRVGASHEAPTGVRAVATVR